MSKPAEPVVDVPAAPVDEMHQVFTELLGGDPPNPKLTAVRREKYRALWGEYLAELDDWVPLWRSLLLAITESDFHMAQRSYQMPESFLRNPEKRDTWIQKAVDRMNGRGALSESDRRLIRIRRGIEDVDLTRGVFHGD